jgi:hypothetical protein
MNIIHSKSRNRLTPERVDKLLYIQINRRTLRREARFSVSESEDEDVAMQPEPEHITTGTPDHIEEAETHSQSAVEFSEDDLV